ncbi:MAG: DUF502 domain-containing protein [Deltaproteobacteria bacterium]|nr:DUF502 domain-containing protein [Deltaproteobacteria bacterium]MBW2364519.1 DUF502 domain-containing protein [Deltaproteobacteria bacterium]
MKRIVKWFAEGLLILAPIFITIWVAYEVFQVIDHLIPAKVPGMGFIITLSFITFIGFLGSTLLGGLFRYIEKIFSRLPLLKILYNALRDLLAAFAGEKKKFNQPVMVRLSHDGMAKLVGFITQDDLNHLGISNEVSVYCPHSYNFSGQLLIVSKEMVEPLNADSSTVMSFVVSGGVAGTPKSSESE